MNVHWENSLNKLVYATVAPPNRNHRNSLVKTVPFTAARWPTGNASAWNSLSRSACTCMRRDAGLHFRKTNTPESIHTHIQHEMLYFNNLRYVVQEKIDFSWICLKKLIDAFCMQFFVYLYDCFCRDFWNNWHILNIDENLDVKW